MIDYSETFGWLEGRRIIVRATNSGVHVGRFVRVDGDVIVLADAIRILEWTGAESLSEISLTGVGPGSVLSVAVLRIVIREWIELIPLADGVAL